MAGGCSSGGGSDTADFGNNLPPASGPGDVENFFPTTIGSSWNYFATVTNPLNGAPAYFMDEVTVTGTHPVNGQIASVFEETNPSGSGMPLSAYFLKNAGGLAYLGSSDATDTMTAAIVPYILATFPVTPGIVAKFSKSGLDFGVDLDGDGINESANVSVTNTIDGFEPLEMGIGTFARTVKSNEAISGTVIQSQRTVFRVDYALAGARHRRVEEQPDRKRRGEHLGSHDHYRHGGPWLHCERRGQQCCAWFGFAVSGC